MRSQNSPHGVDRLARLIALIAGLLIIVGCSGESTAPQSTPGLSFDFAGDTAGQFQAAGTPTLAEPGVLAPTAYAVALPSTGTFKIIANEAAGPDRGDMLLMSNIPARPGTFELSNVIGGGLLVGLLWDASGFQPQAFYALDSGTVTIADYGPTRVRGTFQGTAMYVQPAGTPVGGIPPGSSDVVPRLLTISDGRFDLPLGDSTAASFGCVLFLCTTP